MPLTRPLVLTLSLALCAQARAEPPFGEPTVLPAPEVPPAETPPEVPGPADAAVPPPAPGPATRATQAPGARSALPLPPLPVQPLLLAAPVRRTRLLAEIEAGFAYQQLFSAHVLSGDVELHMGASFPRLSVGGRIGARVGQTLAGLAVVLVSYGPQIAFPAGRRVRAGAGLDFGMITITRATTSANFFGPYLALHPDLWVDLDCFGRGRALFLHLRILGELYRADARPGIAAHAGLGCRF